MALLKTPLPDAKFIKKNPAYGRHQLSWPMRIVGPIKTFNFFFFFYSFPLALPPQRGGGGKFGSEGGLTNERPRTDHVTWGPMRGLEKNRMGRGHSTDRQTDMLTTRPTWPRGPSWWKEWAFLVDLAMWCERPPLEHKKVVIRDFMGEYSWRLWTSWNVYLFS